MSVMHTQETKEGRMTHGVNKTLARLCLWLVGAVAVGMVIGGMR